MSEDHTHCDDLIDDEAQPQCLRDYLRYNRQPAINKTLPMNQEPVLYASLKADTDGRVYLGTWTDGNPDMQPVKMKFGQKVRVVMASRFGDVGITHNLDAVKGYCARVFLDQLENFTALR